MGIMQGMLEGVHFQLSGGKIWIFPLVPHTCTVLKEKGKGIGLIGLISSSMPLIQRYKVLHLVC